jgi:hypothetical protein
VERAQPFDRVFPALPDWPYRTPRSLGLVTESDTRQSNRSNAVDGSPVPRLRRAARSKKMK